MPSVETAIVPKLMSIRQVAETTGLCEKSIWNATSPRGDLPCIKLGTRTLYRPDHVVDWVDSHIMRAAKPAVAEPTSA